MASSIVTSAAQQLGLLLVEEAKYLYAVSDKIKDLHEELEWMQCYLEDADNRQHEEKVVSKWVAEIRNIAYEASDIIERYLHQVSHPRQDGIWNTVKWFSCVMPAALFLHDIASNIDDLRNRMSKLIPRMQMYGIRPKSMRYNSAMREQRRSYPHIKEKVFGLTEKIEEVVGQLVRNKEVKVVGIFGMGGLGKTTLAKEVFSDRAIKEHFKNNCVWVYISKEFDRRNVFEEILIRLCSSMDKDEREKTRDESEKIRDEREKIRDERAKIRELKDQELPEKICEVLKEKECLVVLDDIWDACAWDKLKPAFETIKSSDSKILITTRKESLLKHADPSGYRHPLELLSEEDSWDLLQQTAFSIQDIKDVEGKDEAEKLAEGKAKVEKLAKEMLKHCNGLPLAIVALGGILASRRTIDELETIHSNIASYLISHMGQDSGNDQVSAVLELSYYDLPFYLKPCFMYLGNFPEDFEIPAQRLYHLWEAEGLVTISLDSIVDIEGASLDDIAESYLEQLADRSMVQVEKRGLKGRIKTCRLHDVMRDMCLKKCKEVNFLNIIECGSSKRPSNYIGSGSSSLANRKLHRCTIYLRKEGIDDSSFDPCLSNAAHIRSLMVFFLGSEIEEIFPRSMRKLSLLRVLDLSGISGSFFLRKLVIGDLIHLRYLSIKDSGIWHLPSCIYDCKYLETLDLRGYPSIKTLSNKLWKLERLRHLFLPMVIMLKGREKLILRDDQLQQMETLKNFNLINCQIENLEKMTNLRFFSFGRPIRDWINKKDFEVLINSPLIATKRLKNRLYLCIEAEVLNEKPEVLTEHALCIKELEIKGRIEVPLDDSDNATTRIFPYQFLTIVRLEDCEIGKGVVGELGKLPNLKRLYLNGKAIRGNKMSCGGFPKLDTLWLSSLSDLEELEVQKGALPNLHTLYIYSCEKLKMIPQVLPSSVEIECLGPCIDGIEKYNTCPHFRKAAAMVEES